MISNDNVLWNTQIIVVISAAQASKQGQKL